MADIAAGMYAYSGVLTALYERERTGARTALEVAMLDALGEWMSQRPRRAANSSEKPGGKRMTALDTEQPTYTLVIDGQRVEAAAGARYDTVDPFRGAPWASAADGDAEDVNRAVAAARRALAGPWGQLTGFGRARLLRRLAELIARDADRLAEIETRDTGKLLREMRGQLASIPEWFYYFSGLADKLQGSTVPVDKPNFLVYTRREPAGVVAAIVPWNSPLLLLTWKLAPALAAGCTVVAKPSDYSPASAVELAALMDEAGFPPGVFNVVTGFGPAVGKALAAHPDVDKVAFTGSTAVGAEVAKAAAANITDVLLELGGKSAHVVFDDADLDAACNGVLAGVFAATGQTCMAGRGCWSAGTCTTHWWTRSLTAPAGSGWATRGPRTPRWARWRPSRSTARCCRSWTRRPARARPSRRAAAPTSRSAGSSSSRPCSPASSRP